MRFPSVAALARGGSQGSRGPGVIYVIPGFENAIRVDLRTVTMDIPSQDVITKDNVSLKLNAVLYFRVVDPNRAVVEVENYLFATSQDAQTTLRSVCGEVELDELLAEREKINTHLQTIIDQHTDPWGIRVVEVAVKHIDLPEQMRRAMARQAAAERERRAKVIAAEGEFQNKPDGTCCSDGTCEAGVCGALHATKRGEGTVVPTQVSPARGHSSLNAHAHVLVIGKSWPARGRAALETGVELQAAALERDQCRACTLLLAFERLELDLQ